MDPGSSEEETAHPLLEVIQESPPELEIIHNITKPKRIRRTQEEISLAKIEQAKLKLQAIELQEQAKAAARASKRPVKLQVPRVIMDARAPRSPPLHRTQRVQRAPSPVSSSTDSSPRPLPKKDMFSNLVIGTRFIRP